MKNRIILYCTILIIGLLIAIPSTTKVVKKHNQRLMTYTLKKIEEAAKYCYYNNSCVEETITLSELYEKTNLTQMYNPITKEVYNESSYIDIKNNFRFIEIKNN